MAPHTHTHECTRLDEFAVRGRFTQPNCVRFQHKEDLWPRVLGNSRLWKFGAIELAVIGVVRRTHARNDVAYFAEHCEHHDGVSVCADVCV